MFHAFNSPEPLQHNEVLPTRTVIGFPVSVLSFDEQISTMIKWAQRGLSRTVCVANVHMLMEGHWHPEFAQVLSKSDLLTPDGMPLVWLTSLMNRQRQERAAGMDIMLALCKQAQAAGISIFLLGSTPEMLSKIHQKLSDEFPALIIAGMESPPFRPLSSEEDRAIVEKINASGAGLLFVSLGCPKQERWMHTHHNQVNSVMVGLGGAFPVYAGVQQWAPTWVRQLGLEWLYRLYQEPKRLWRRYANTIPPFVWLAIKQVIKVKLGLDPDLSFRQQWLRDA